MTQNFKIVDRDNNEIPSDELLEMLSTWAGFKLVKDIIDEEANKVKAEHARKDELIQRLIYASCLFHSTMVEFSKHLECALTPFVTAQIMHSYVIELLYSALLAEKEILGTPVGSPTEVLQEVVDAVKDGTRHTLAEILVRCDNGTFIQRVTGKMESAANVKGTTTKQ